MDGPKPYPKPEFTEGSEAARRFDHLVRRVIFVPRDEFKKRQEAWERVRKEQRRKTP